MPLPFLHSPTEIPIGLHVLYRSVHTAPSLSQTLKFGVGLCKHAESVVSIIVHARLQEVQLRKS